ncbi:Piso0_005374 [Millerozyma farinosa CBS 7064]|uniref:Ribonuclease H2 subunit B n=1 Tax=Pichia sorbitophila (strain ATCC MYA-4447 / BCRC 22081 / CBS 7064 / NBRC 10061 / NRRL Y-12695) TaxID=559304 RepID=G8Y4X9_PICSO|nr:Piso0_005374 [Millerozyma farinosa CBS 7064]
MLVDNATRVILLPQGEQSYSIIRLPSSTSFGENIVCLIQGDTMYEIREINGKNPYMINMDKVPKLPNNDGAVKSLIFESDTNGYVLQNPNLLVTSKFNFAYFLISVMHGEENFAKRFITLEDIIDSLGSKYSGQEWVTSVPFAIYIRALGMICEKIEENDETFYKYSKDKAFTFLQNKIDEVTKYLLSKPHVALNKKIMSELLSSSIDSTKIPSEVLQESTTKHSIDLICGSYIPVHVKQEFCENKKYSWSNLDKYLADLAAEKKGLELAESNMNSIINETVVNRKDTKSDSKKKPARKKVVNKVPVGKGALDGFFKKA